MKFKNLRAIREDRDIRQKDISAYLNVSQNTYSQYETGVISLTAEILIKLSDFYNVSIDYLLDRTNNPNLQKWILFLCKSPQQKGTNKGPFFVEQML